MKMWFTESHYTATDMMTVGPGLVFAIASLVRSLFLEGKLNVKQKMARWLSQLPPSHWSCVKPVTNYNPQLSQIALLSPVMSSA